MKRPKLHITPVKNWMNDPNGFIYFNGKYHLFYQHFPYEPVWGTMHWGHLVGEDLAHMVDVGIALYPSVSYDANGCFSGSAIDLDGKMAIYYTSVRYDSPNPENIHISGGKIIQSQSMIISEDGVNFDNYSKKMIIPPITDKNIGDVYDTRDPKVFRYNGKLYMVLGTKHEGCGRILVYSSCDGNKWDLLAVNDDDRLGTMLECPDLYCVNGQWIMTLSPENTLNDGVNYPSHCQYSLIDFDCESGKIALLTDPQYIDWGLDYYAAQSATDKDGRRVIIGWMRMPEPVDDWSGIFTFPRIIDYIDGHVCYRVHPDIRKEFCQKCDSIDTENAYHICARIKEGGYINVSGYKITLEDGRIKTDRGRVFSNVQTLFGHKSVVGKQFSTPVIGDNATLDIYIDKNIIEVYVNDGYYVLSNVLYNQTGQFTYENAEVITIEKAR